MDKYPVPAIAYFDDSPGFIPLTTASSNLLRVNRWNHLYVTNDAHSGSSIVSYGVTKTGKKVPISVLDDGTVNVYLDDTPGIQRGSCTNSAGIGYLDYISTATTILDSISMSAGELLNIYSLHAFGNVAATVELILKIDTTVTRLLVGGVIESTPNWDPNFNMAIEIPADQDQTVEVRIQGLRTNRTGQGTGRIFARSL